MATSTLAIFDLDDTLLAGDSDYEWGRYLVDMGIVDRVAYETQNQEFYDRYRAGTLVVEEFLEFQLAPLARFPMAQLEAWRADFVASRILPIVRPGARALLERHRESERLIITATNSFITGPIAAALGITTLLATDPERIDGRFTGRASGVPCFREGKVVRLTEWLAAKGKSLSDYRESWFYSDSVNDIPLLSLVTHPVAVSPDERLLKHAIEHNWPVTSLDKP